MASRTFSPNAPKREIQGALGAIKFYAMMSKYPSVQVVKSAIGLHQHFCQTGHYEFANGFLDMATIIAQGRLLR